ncbi:DUF5666 domain-containing protein [Photobacterium iliopiscarium]|uniref:DUF5666 domain-containing protein n=1 Tax=Photobacterium iliopiscarium TaxID=56192 RepID=UPI0005D3E028|nr:DUF5666 domain-containing protein [Photobacterium iliopiscarium]KJG14657.1 hypothetical protein UB38_01790 [Photobacterium iliopiscarium]PSU01871.1 hypothetical protein C9I85_01475 [Photobacterium iliopiscarium]PSV84219.1 hypothetical protein C9J51_04040 [Photobacterium iliopiscarium]
MKKITLATLIGLILTGCGGGGGDDSTAPQPPVEIKPQTVQGTINAVNVPANTIEVNGYSYDVASVAYGTDIQFSIKDLQKNMMVAVSTSSKAGALVQLEPTMVGKVTYIDRANSTFVINGATLTFSLDQNIDVSDWVMVSSLPQATETGLGYKVLSVVKFEHEGLVGQYEVEGRLSSLNENNKTFTLGAATQVRYTDNIIEDNATLQNGQWVEVKGQMVGDTFDASEVDVETYDASDNDNEIEGVVTWVSNDKSQFELNARGHFMVTGSTYFEDGTKANLNMGVMVEVTAVNGIAREIEFENDFDGDFGDAWHEFEKKGILANITATSFTVNDFKIEIDSQTFVDKNEKLVDLDGSRVEVEGVIIGSRYVAREIEREDD